MNGLTENYTYDNADKLQSITSPSGNKTYIYDNAGRTKTVGTSTGTTTFTYDYDGHVTGITYPNASTNSSSYNGLGTRVKRVDAASGTRTFLHDGLAPADNVLYDGGVSYSPGVSERSYGGQDRWYNDNGLGSLTDMTDSSGNLLAARTWDAFGNQQSGITFSYLHGYGESGNYEEDKDSGLKLLGNRYYDPAIGRFLTPDPAGFGSNWYDYCDNNPIGNQDPSGLISQKVEEDGTYVGGEADSGWWDGNGMQFSGRQNLEAMASGSSALLRAMTFGHYGDASMANAPGCGFSTCCGYVADAALVAAVALAAGPAVVARLTSASLNPATATNAIKFIAIGETMDRFREQAADMGAEMFLEPFTDHEDTMIRNKEWLLQKLNDGYQVLDYGYAPGRSERSPFYQMELDTIEEWIRARL